MPVWPKYLKLILKATFDKNKYHLCRAEQHVVQKAFHSALLVVVENGNIAAFSLVPKTKQRNLRVHLAVTKVMLKLHS